MLAELVGFAVATGGAMANPRVSIEPVSFFRESSKQKLEAELAALTVGASRCEDIESHLASRSIRYSVWDHGADGDGTHRYTIVQRRPKDNSLWDDFLSRDLYARIEVVDCVIKSKTVEYTYTFL